MDTLIESIRKEEIVLFFTRKNYEAYQCFNSILFPQRVLPVNRFDDKEIRKSCFIIRNVC